MKRHNSPVSSKTSKLQIVPWFNKKEWEETYQLAYSTDYKLQEKAYTQMSIWKARYPNLPLGVECTMSTLHVKLCDKDRGSGSDSSVYTDRDLQLLYSTAVMRFLNQLTVLSDRKDSMYKVAQDHQLPDWIINLRHEAAHGNSVPALFLLRQAADIILQWLKDNYWEAEAKIMEDVVRQPEHLKEKLATKITNLLDLWVKLKLHYWSELKTIDKIEDKDVRDQAMDLATEEGCGIKIRRQGNKNTPTKARVEGNNEVDMEGNNDVDMEGNNDVDMEGNNDVDMEGNDNQEGTQDEYTHKIKTAFEPLLRSLFEPLKMKTYKKVFYQNCLIDCLARHKGFCLPIDLEELSESEALELMSLMGDLWKEVLEGLQSNNVLHLLLNQLLSQDDQLASGQLWLRLITQQMAGHPPPHPPGTARLSQIAAECLPCAVDHQVLIKRINQQHKTTQQTIDLKPASAEELAILQKLARNVVDNPTSFTTQYLHSLLSLWEPRLTWDTREKLCALARIYNGRKPLRIPPTQVHTTFNLGAVEEDVKGETKAQGLGSDSSPWKLYTGDADWSRCALGALPW